MNSKTISIVIPCYNEELVLPLLFDRLNKAANAWKYDFEVICIDDGSSDRTWEILKSYQAQNPRWKALSLSRNFGHQTALSAGLEHVSGDAVIVLDADLQDPPEELHRFIAEWEKGFDIVYAIRKKRKEGLIKRACYFVFYRTMASIAQFEIPLDSGDFCLMDRRVVDVIRSMPERNRFIRGLRAWSGFRQSGVEYERSERQAGESQYTFSKLLKLALDGLFSFSAVPLRLSAHVGFAISGVALLGIAFTLAQRLFQSYFESMGLGTVPGYATIVIAVLFLGGIQLICLGIIGEYLYRIFEEVKARPIWILKDSAGFEKTKPF